MALLFSACTTAGGSSTTTSPVTEPTLPPTVTTVETTTTTTTTVPEEPTEITDTFLPDPLELTDEVVGTDGGASIGDSYYPRLGNAGYDVTHVELSIDFRRLQEGAFFGEAILYITPLQPLETFVLDTGTLLPDRVDEDLGGDGVWTPARLGRESESEHRIGLSRTAEDPFVIRVRYRGVPEPIHHRAIPFSVGIRPGPDSWFAVSEPAGATTWFPANDHPLDKATYDVSLTVADGLTGVTGGEFLGSEATLGGGTTFSYRFDRPLASYLLALAVGDFKRVDRGLVEGIVVRDYVDPDVEPGVLTPLERVPEILEWMIGVFGEYPFKTYGTLALDTRFGGALETQTLSTHGADALGTNVLVHEMAHQWFGDSVSLSDFSDMWLNEGFATYAEWLWVEHDRGSDLFDAVVSSGYDRYLTFPAPGTPPANNLFNGGVYIGGASVLHGLRLEMGDGPFFALLKAWAQDNQHGNVTTEDFIDMAERFAGRQLDDWFEQWLTGEG